jgi:hypothetical protein
LFKPDSFVEKLTDTQKNSHELNCQTTNYFFTEASSRAESREFKKLKIQTGFLVKTPDDSRRIFSEKLNPSHWQQNSKKKVYLRYDPSHHRETAGHDHIEIYEMKKPFGHIADFDVLTGKERLNSQRPGRTLRN